MNTIGRILIILAAAMVVVGATLAITNIGSPTQFPASDPGSEAFRPGGDRLGNLDSGQTSPRPEAFDGGFRRGRDEIGGRSFFSAQLTRNLAVIAGLVVVVTLLERLLKIRRPMWR